MAASSMAVAGSMPDSLMEAAPMPAKLAQPGSAGVPRGRELTGANGGTSTATTGRQRTLTPAPIGRLRRITARDPRHRAIGLRVTRNPHRRAIRPRIRVIAGTAPRPVTAVRLRITGHFRLHTRRLAPPVEASQVDIRVSLGVVGMRAAEEAAAGSLVCPSISWRRHGWPF